MKNKIKWGVIGSCGIARRHIIPDGLMCAANAGLAPDAGRTIDPPALSLLRGDKEFLFYMRPLACLVILPVFCSLSHAQRGDSPGSRPPNIAGESAHDYLPAPSPARIFETGSNIIVHRTMMPESGPSSFAVGFAGGLGLCYDPGRGGINYIWRGEFADLSPTWQGKINRPAEIRGAIVHREFVRFPLRLGAAEREPRVEFKGYSLRGDGVEFRYLVDGVLIHEELRASPDGHRLTRTFRVGGPIERWWYWIEPQATAAIESPEGSWNEARTVLSGSGPEFSIVVQLEGGKR